MRKNPQNDTSTQAYAWLVIFVSSLFLIYKYVLQVSPSIMTSELMENFHMNGVGLSNLAATFFYTYFIVQIFVGVLLDKYGVRWLTSCAILTSAIGCFIFSVANTFTFAIVGRAFMGVGAAFATVSYMKNAAVWFRANQFAFVGGLLATAAMIGALFGQTPLAYMVKYLSWRSSMGIIGFIGIVIALAFMLVVRHRHSNAIEITKLNNSVGYRDLLFVIKKPQNWLLTFYSGLAFAPIAVFGGLWGIPFLRVADHLNLTQAAALTSTAFLGLAVGGPVLGWLAGRINNCRIVMLWGSLISLMSISLVFYVTGMPYFLTMFLLFLFGFGTGAFMLGFAVGKRINEAAFAATIVALINTGDAIFGAVTEPLVGKILDMGWHGKMYHGARIYSLGDYHTAFFVMVSYIFIAIMAAYFVKNK